MLFGVKYMINPGYYLVYSETPQITMPTVNTNVLNLGYMVEDGVKDVSIEGRNVFDNSNMILQRMTGLDGEVFVPHNTYDVISNGIVYDEETFSLKRNANEAGYILFTVPYDENYQGAYLQFENPYSVYSLEDLLFVSGGENIYGIGNRILASQANKMSPVEGQDIYALRIDADADAPTEYIFYGVNMVYYSQETLDEYYADLADEQLAVEEWKDGYVKGRITVNSDRRLLFLSIPYEKGWNITVNGKKVEPLAVLDDAFMAIELPGKGTYDIEMKFNCPGVIMGLIVTLTGVIMTAIMYFIQKKKSDKISAIKNDETHAEDDSLNVKTLQAEEEEENAVSSDEGNNAEHDTNTEE